MSSGSPDTGGRIRGLLRSSLQSRDAGMSEATRRALQDAADHPFTYTPDPKARPITIKGDIGNTTTRVTHFRQGHDPEEYGGALDANGRLIRDESQLPFSNQRSARRAG